MMFSVTSNAMTRLSRNKVSRSLSLTFDWNCPEVETRAPLLLLTKLL